MSISIRKAFRSVASDNYNKTNLSLYLVLLFVIGILASFFAKDGKNLSAEMIILLLVYFFACILIAGVNAIAINNAMKKIKGVIPNLIDDIASITKIGFQYSVGAFLSAFLMVIVCGAVMFIFMKIFPLLGLIILPLALFLAVLYFGLYFNYVTTFKFSKWFDFKQAFDFLKMSKKQLGIYILKIIIVQIIICIIAFVLIFMISFSIGFIGALISSNPETLKVMSVALSACINAVLFGIGGIYMIDLAGQFLREVLSVKHK